MKLQITVTVIVLTLISNSLAIKRKPIEDVDTDAFTADTQVTAQGAGDDHMVFAWWVPNEFWESIFSRDTSMTESERKEILDTLSGVSLLAVVQADISSFGAFQFYSKEEIEKNMNISFTDAKGKKQKLSVMQNPNPDLEVLIGMFKPILAAAMGNLGNNMHFFVLSDKTKSSERLLDPYQDGEIDIQLSRKDNALMTASIEMPLNALFVPRKCPNGKDAHVSWKYCPWTGEPLEE